MINPNVNSARCISCGQQRPFTLELTLCPACGGNLDLQYDSDAVRKQLTPQRLAEDPDHTLWRYGPLLPLALDEAPTPLTVGWTPLVPAPRLGRRLGLTRLALKDEGRNPSGSLKDRASAMVLAGALAGGRDRVVGASTGNAGSSMACLCAGVGLGCVIFVPASAPRAKLAQLRFRSLITVLRGRSPDGRISDTLLIYEVTDDEILQALRGGDLGTAHSALDTARLRL